MEEARNIPKEFYDCIDDLLFKRKIFANKNIPIDLRVTF